MVGWGGGGGGWTIRGGRSAGLCGVVWWGDVIELSVA